MVGNKAKKAIAAALSGAMVLGAAAPALAGVFLNEDETWVRINGDHQESYQLGTDLDADDGGEPGVITNQPGVLVEGVDRYDTMFDAINYNVTDSGVWQQGTTNYVVVASGESLADSLTAAGLAGVLNGVIEEGGPFNGAPVITTPSGKLGIQAKRALEYYAQGRKDYKDADKLHVYVVGGSAAVSDSVYDEIADLDGVIVERLAGADRVETSLAVFNEMIDWVKDYDYTATSAAGTVLVPGSTFLVANGFAWADALSASSIAYQSASPILLTNADGKLSDAQLKAIEDADDSKTSVWAIGGPASEAYKQVQSFKKGGVSWIHGDDRYETSKLVVEEAVKNDMVYANTIAVASGQDSHAADALVGGPFVGANQGVLVLADPGHLDALKVVKDAKSGNVAGYGYIIGGENAVSAGFAAKVVDAIEITPRA